MDLIPIFICEWMKLHYNEKKVVYENKTNSKDHYSFISNYDMNDSRRLKNK